MKSVVSFRRIAVFCSNVSTKEDIFLVGQSQPEMIGLLTGIGLWIFVSV